MEVAEGLLWLAAWIGGPLLGQYLSLLPATLFLRGEAWKTEEELRQQGGGPALALRVLTPWLIGWVLPFGIVFFGAMAASPNKLPLALALPLLFVLWMYVPIGLLELVARVSVQLGEGSRGGLLAVSSGRAPRAGAFRLCLTAGVWMGLLVLAFR